MQPHHAVALGHCFFEGRNEGRQNLGHLGVLAQCRQDGLVLLGVTVVDELLQGVAAGGRATPIGEVDLGQAHDRVQQTLQLRTRVGVELSDGEGVAVFRLDVLRVLGLGSPALEVLLPFLLGQQQGQHLDQRTAQDYIQVGFLLGLQDGFHLLNPLRQHGHADQFHLNDDLQARQHQRVI